MPHSRKLRNLVGLVLLLLLSSEVISVLFCNRRAQNNSMVFKKLNSIQSAFKLKRSQTKVIQVYILNDNNPEG